MGQIADGTEQTLHDVVLLTEIEVPHIANIEFASRHFLLRLGDEVGFEVDAIDGVVRRQQSRVFGRAASNIKNAVRDWMQSMQQCTNARNFVCIIFEGVDAVVILGGLGEHRTNFSLASAHSDSSASDSAT